MPVARRRGRPQACRRRRREFAVVSWCSLRFLRAVVRSTLIRRPLPFPPPHSASLTRVNALMLGEGRGSLLLLQAELADAGRDIIERLRDHLLQLLRRR